MNHASRHGESKLLHNCALPLTGGGAVDRIVTGLGVFDVVERDDSVTETEAAPPPRRR
jgi:3-oxoacid CoA-transferase subunit B